MSMGVARESAAATATAIGYAARSAASPLAPLRFERRAPGPRDVQIEILHCGICHSDLHTARDEWAETLAATTYPVVPGHEIVGRVSAVGGEVERFAVGDNAGVGCMVDSCQRCEACAEGLEQFCEKGATFTYDSPDPQSGGTTHGGYSSSIVVDEGFVLKIAADADLAATAPLLCAGITTYSPLRRFGAGPGTKLGVVGLGGLGHIAVRIGAALGAEVTLFTTSAAKAEEGKRLGAGQVFVTSAEGGLRGAPRDFDLIVDTVSASHDLDPYLRRLRRDGALVLLGVPSAPHPLPGVAPLLGHRFLTGSNIGGIAETQEMLDFCAGHGVVAEIEPIAIEQVNEAYDRLAAGDVRFRFVIDMSTLPTEPPV